MVAPVGIDPTTAADEALVIRFADYQSEHRPNTQSVSQEGTIKIGGAYRAPGVRLDTEGHTDL